MTTPILFAVISPKMTSWLTPIWVIGLGALLGIILLMALWGSFWLLSRTSLLGNPPTASWQTTKRATGMSLVLAVTWFLFLDLGSGGWFSILLVSLLVWLASWCICFSFLVLCWRRTVDETVPAVTEGPLWPLAYLVGVLALFGVLGAFVAEQPREILASLVRLPVTGSQEHLVKLTAPESGNIEPTAVVVVEFQLRELREMTIKANGRVSISYDSFEELVGDPLATITPEEPFESQRPDFAMATGIPDATVEEIYLRNESGRAAEVSIAYRTSPVHSQVRSIPLVAIGISLVVLFYLVQRMAMPRLSAISLSTFKSEVAQPLFWIFHGIGLFAMVVFVFIPYNTFGEDIKMLKDTGLTMIMVLGILASLWAASTSIAEEIEGRTALTVLSKPISRRSFIVGKFMGIAWTTFLLFAFLGIVFMVAVSLYGPIIESRETSTLAPPWQASYMEMASIFPGLLLAFMETLVLASLSVAISTRLNLLANFTICLVIYLLGHLTPLLVQSSISSFDIVRFFGQLIATIFPNLEHFNIQAAVAAGVSVPYEYLGWAFFYCLVYSVIALLLALVMFEDRDLA